MTKVIKSLMLIAVLGSSPAFGAILLVDSNTGQLTGAEGVVVGEGSFDVEFLGGNCDSLFDGCARAAFTFSNVDDATLAAQALLDQVFLDVAQGLFDSNPSLTSGCFSRFGCSTFTAYDSTSTTVSLSSAVNVRPGAGVFDRVATGVLDLDAQEFTEPAFVQGITFARWTRRDVPAPTVLPLLASSIIFLAWFRRRKVEIKLAI